MTKKTIEIHVPSFPESIETGEIIAWNKKVGEPFERDEVLAEIETDKVVMEVPAQSEGVLIEINKDVGSMVSSTELIGLMEEKTFPKSQSTQKKDSTNDTVTKISPSAKQLAQAENLTIQDIPATGNRNTITKADVQSFLKQQKGSTPTIADNNTATGSRKTRRVSMSRLRTTIAQRLLDVQKSRAILTTFNEVNLQAIDALRKQYKESFIDAHGVKLGFMSFFVQACCDALKKYPVINASSDENSLTYHDYQDIGIAVSTERGLVVPVLRNAADMSLAAIEQNIVDFATRARNNKLTLEELQGGTFTITNGGVFGSLLSTPIINPPQSAILGMHSIQRRPVAENDTVVVRPMMYLALSYDHRIIDGKEAVLFLRDVKDTLENPGKRLLDL